MRRGLLILFVGCVVALVAFVSLKESWGSSARTLAAIKATDISSSTIVSVAAPLATNTPQAESTAKGMRTYTNAAFDFSLTYPSDLSVSKYDEGEGVTSIVFQEANERAGFQIFVTPYPYIGEPITQARIKADVPTLDMQDTDSLTIGTGTQALSFASSDPDFGPTRELWFAHGSYLFEVVTYPDRAAWLAPIINTIRFP
jgi:hypothetical protein